MHAQRAVGLFHEGAELCVVLVDFLDAQNHLVQREGLEVRGLLGDVSALVSKQVSCIPSRPLHADRILVRARTVELLREQQLRWRLP